jgi:hypothetical protein
MFTKTLNKFLVLSPISGRQTVEDNLSATTELVEPVVPVQRSDSNSSASSTTSTGAFTGGFLKLGYDRIAPKTSP